MNLDFKHDYPKTYRSNAGINPHTQVVSHLHANPENVRVHLLRDTLDAKRSEAERCLKDIKKSFSIMRPGEPIPESLTKGDELYLERLDKEIEKRTVALLNDPQPKKSKPKKKKTRAPIAPSPLPSSNSAPQKPASLVDSPTMATAPSLQPSMPMTSRMTAFVQPQMPLTHNVSSFIQLPMPLAQGMPPVLPARMPMTNSASSFVQPQVPMRHNASSFIQPQVPMAHRMPPMPHMPTRMPLPGIEPLTVTNELDEVMETGGLQTILFPSQTPQEASMQKASSIYQGYTTTTQSNLKSHQAQQLPPVFTQMINPQIQIHSTIPASPVISGKRPIEKEKEKEFETVRQEEKEVQKSKKRRVEKETELEDGIDHKQAAEFTIPSEEFRPLPSAITVVAKGVGSVIIKEKRDLFRDNYMEDTVTIDNQGRITIIHSHDPLHPTDKQLSECQRIHTTSLSRFEIYGPTFNYLNDEVNKRDFFMQVVMQEKEKDRQHLETLSQLQGS